MSIPLMGAGPSGAGGAISFADIPNLRLWLNPDGNLWQDRARTVPAVADGDRVRAWDDASGNALHAIIDNDAGVATLKIANGVKVVRFDGGFFSRFATPAFTLFPSKRGLLLASLVMTATQETSIFLATFSGAGNNMACYLGLSVDKRKYYDGTQHDAAEFDLLNRWYVQQFYRTGNTELKFYRDDSLADTLAVQDLQQAELPLIVGGITTSANFTGDFRDIVVYDSITEADRIRVQALALGRKGLTTLVCFGDSITTGSGASDAAHSWASLVATSKGMNLVRSGISSTLLQNSVQNTIPTIGAAADNNGRDTYTTRVTPYAPSTCIILYGLNDLRLNDAGITVANFQNDLGEVVDGIVSAGTAASRIVLGSPTYIPVASYGGAPWDGGNRTKHAAYVAATAAVASAKGTGYVDVYQWMADNGGDTLISGDGIHPNDAGHAAIAAAFLSVL